MAFPVPRDVPVQGRSLPRGIRLRRGTVEDEPATFDVMKRAVGLEMSWADHSAARRHLRASPHSSYWLAEEAPRFGKSRVVAYGHSIVRDKVWHLTEFFAYPSHQRQGIGGALLARCLEDGVQAGADTRFVLASTHPAADALYMRQANCFPRVPMFLLSGPILALRPLTSEELPIQDTVVPSSVLGSYFPKPHTERQAAALLIAEPISLKPEVQCAIDMLDREAVGFARPPEHAHWIAQTGGTQGAARLFRRSAEGDRPGEVVGYAYYGPHSTGPAVARNPNDLPRMLTHVTGVSRALGQSAADAGFIKADPYWAVAGENEVVLRWLLRCGWQIIFQYLFMSSRPLGQLNRYVCHNPLHFL